MFSKLKQFKDIRDKAKVIQSQLAHESAEGSAAWGKVKVTIDGNQHVTNVVIDPTVLDDAKKLSDAVKDATNDAMTKIQKIMAQKLKESGGLDLAGDLKDIFGK